MSHDELTWLSAHELRSMVASRSISPVEIVTAVLDQLNRVNPAINAFVTVTAESALAQARDAENLVMRTSAEDLPPLLGIPITVKDLTDTAGVRTTYGSKLYRDNVPTLDAVPWARIKAAGAILIGKTTTPEFGMLGVTESQLTGVTGNPWAPTHTAGGSSGGAAASVAAGVAPLAWGSDSGGSIRVPAACCGVVGLKPSLGRVPTTGEETPWETIATSGPLTRSVRDAAMLLDVTAGPYSRDPLSLPASDENYEAATIGSSLRGVRIAYSPDLSSGPVDAGVLAVFAQALAELEDSLGALVERVDFQLPDPVDYFATRVMPDFAMTIDHFSARGLDASAWHPRMLSMAERGRDVSFANYWHAEREIRGEISDAFADVHERFDLLVTPTMPLTSFPHPGPDAGPREIGGHPSRDPAVDFHRLTEPPSHAGLPAITIPCGFDPNGLPVGMQIIGRPHGDASILAAAAAYEASTSWHTARPESNPRLQ